jgi:toxin ParE1/3/4
MSARIIRTPQARRDLIELGDYIAANNISAAERFLEAVDKALEFLGAMPEIGHPWETENPRYAGIRWWIIKGFRNHLIFYRPIGEGIEVLRVVYGSRDLDTLFAD